MIGAIPDSAAEIRARGGVAGLGDEEELRNLDPNGIAPFICYLASDYAANVNGQTFLVYGNTVSLMSQPRPERSIYTSNRRWSLDELAPLARTELTGGIFNPTPSRE
jgi:hypothetical protein